MITKIVNDNYTAVKYIISGYLKISIIIRKSYNDVGIIIGMLNSLYLTLLTAKRNCWS